MRGETKAALDNFYQINKTGDESRYDFCRNNGWKEYIDTMLVVDYLILNRDRHGANIEVLRNARKHSVRIAPLFDHGLSLLCSCYTEEEIKSFDVMADKPCNNFIGSRSVLDNLKLVTEKANVFGTWLKEKDKDILLENLQGILSPEHLDKIWNMIWSRWCNYEDLCNL